MKKNNYRKIANNVIDLEILALKKLKKSINNSFKQAVDAIVKCQSKIILCGVGKSGHVASRIAASLSSVGSPAFALSASDCSHGDLGSISKKDVLILISYSGETEELKNIIQYANRNKITLIGIVSKKNSILYKASDIKILIPEIKEAGPGNIVPSSSIIIQSSIGDALSIAAMKQKKFGKQDFKKFHPSGSIGAKLKTVEDLMLTGKKIPFISENQILKNAIKIISNKKLGILIIIKSNKRVLGVITDGDLRRIVQKNKYIPNVKIKYLIKKKPISIEKDTLAVKALEIMNTNKITSLCVFSKKNKNKIVGIVHIHNLLEANIS
tara:strand:- start:149 stop:1123 length:975 start_codon:yes stop_codon:yes gene_type:complete